MFHPHNDNANDSDDDSDDAYDVQPNQEDGSLIVSAGATDQAEDDEGDDEKETPCPFASSEKFDHRKFGGGGGGHHGGKSRAS